MSNSSSPPKAGAKDVAVAVTRAALSAVPLVGGPAVELFGLAVKSPLETRRDEYLADLGLRLTALEQAGHISLQSLCQDPVFVDNVLHSTLAALRTRHASKRAALRNAVLNSVLPGAPEADMQEILIGLVDALFPWHLAILGLLARDPAAVSPTLHLTNRIHMRISELIEEAFPELVGKQGVYLHFLADLQARGLASTAQITPDLASAPWAFTEVTSLGRQLLAFVSEPEMGTKSGA